jgi:hypothetical protein
VAMSPTLALACEAARPVVTSQTLAVVCVQDPVAARLKDVVDDFKELLPLVQELGNPALQARHWEDIFGIIGASILPNESGIGAWCCLSTSMMQDAASAVERLQSPQAGQGKPCMQGYVPAQSAAVCNCRQASACLIACAYDVAPLPPSLCALQHPPAAAV